MVAALAGCVLTPIAYPGTADALASTVTTSVRYDRTIIFDDLFAPVSFQAPGTPGDETTLPFTVTTSVRHDKTVIFDDLAYTPYVTEVITSDKWFAPPSQPTRRKVTVPVGTYVIGAIQPQAGDAVGWHRALSEPTRRKPFLEGDIAFTPTQAQANDGIGWYAPLSDPMRRKVTRQHQTVAFYSEPIPARDWYRPLSEPTRRVTTRQQQELASIPFIEDAAIQAKWFQPFGQPRAAKRVPEFPAHSYSPYFVPAVTGDAVALTTWANLSEPTRGTVRRQHQSFAFYSLPLPAWGWAQPLGTPRAAKRLVEYQATFYPPYFVPPGAGPGVELNWWPNLSERLRQRTPVSQQQAFSFAGKPDDPAWFYPALDQPTRIKVRQNQGSFVYPYQTVVVDVGGDDTAQPFTVATSVRHDRAIIFDELAWAPYPIAPASGGVGTEFNWWPNLSERLRQRQPVAQQQTFIYGTYVTPDGVGAAPATFGGPTFSRHLISQTLAMPAALVAAPTPGDGSALPFTVTTSLRYERTIIFDDLAWAPFPVAAVTDLDPACRVIISIGDVDPDASSRDTVITPEADRVVTTGETDDVLTPTPSNTITVKC